MLNSSSCAHTGGFFRREGWTASAWRIGAGSARLLGLTLVVALTAGTFAGVARAQDAPVQVDPGLAIDPAPVETAPTDPALADPALTDPALTDPAPTDPAPTDPAPIDPAPIDPAPTDPAPTDPAPTDPGPADTAPPPEAPPSDPAPPVEPPSDLPGTSEPPAGTPPGPTGIPAHDSGPKSGKGASVVVIAPATNLPLPLLPGIEVGLDELTARVGTDTRLSTGSAASSSAPVPSGADQAASDASDLPPPIPLSREPTAPAGFAGSGGSATGSATGVLGALVALLLVAPVLLSRVLSLSLAPFRAHAVVSRSERPG